MFITPKRCKQIRFSEPSYGIGQAMLVKAGNPKGIKDYATFAANPDVKLAVMAGAVEGGYAKDAGVKRSQLMVLPDQASMLAGVQGGRADAAALTARCGRRMPSGLLVPARSKPNAILGPVSPLALPRSREQPALHPQRDARGTIGAKSPGPKWPYWLHG